MESSIILSYITSTKLGDGSWNGTTESFILNWKNQVCLYEKHVPPTDHFSDCQKWVMLPNAVHGIEELRQVKNTADHIETTSGTAMSYDGYVSLLLSASSADDEQFKPKRAKRHVLLHNVHDHDDDQDKAFFDHVTKFDIDCPASSIQAYSTNFRSKPMAKSNNARVRMASDKWFGLDAASKAIWDCLDDKAKSIILGYRYSKPDPTKPAFSGNYPPFRNSSFGQSGKPPFNAQANLHEISAYDFHLANIHEIAPSEDDPDPELVIDEHEDLPVSDESNDTRLINAA